MTLLNWKAQLADYVKNPRFASYGAADETRPVKVDCSLGINPLDLYSATNVNLKASHYAGYPVDGHNIKHLGGYIKARFPLVDPGKLCFGAGSQGTISSLSRVLGGPKVKVLGLIPTFIPALIEFASAGAQVETLKLAAPYRIDVDQIIPALTEDTTLVYLDNPNNPTGQVLPLAELDRLAKACAEHGALLMVDEAYSDFIDDTNSAFFLTHSNLICTRSFSKGCGLAGSRTGYILIRDEELRKHYLQTALLFSSSVVAADLDAHLLPGLDLGAMRQGVKALKKEVLEFIGGYPQFSVGITSEETPILFLIWSNLEGDLYDTLMTAGILTEAGPYFALPANAVRLRVPSPRQMGLFRDLWREKFG